MKLSSLKTHFIELKSRFLKTTVFFLMCFAISYYFKEQIYLYLVSPLERKIIYTGLTEAFFTYIKITAFVAFIFTIPMIAWQIYCFIAPGLYKKEREIALIILSCAPLLFALGGCFVFYFIIPKAWHFFLSFELNDSISPLVLEPRISEYLNLVIELIIAFGLAFQLPVIFIILALMNIITADFLSRKRRGAIVIIFIIAGIITPPDALSQIALAIPMLLLYEISIASCKLLENRGKNA